MSILKVLDDILLEKQKKSKLYSISPSRAGKCLRAAIYGKLGFAPREFPPRILRVFEDGNMHEDMVIAHIRLLEEQGYLSIINEQYEVWIDLDKHFPGRKMHGFIDVLVSLDGKPLPIEVKSASKSSYAMAKRQPHFNHVLQLNCYLKATGQEIGWIWYKNKDNAEYCIHEVEFSEAIWDQTMAYFKKVERIADTVEPHVEQGAWVTDRSDLLPARPFWKTDFDCMFCNYSDLCWKGFEERLKEFTTASDEEFDPTLARYYELKTGSKEADAELAVLKEQIRAKLLENEANTLLSSKHEASLKRFGKHMGVVVRKI